MSDPLPPTGDWSPAELQQHGVQLFDRIRWHFETIREQPVTSQIDATELWDQLAAPLPELPVSFESIVDDTWQNVVPHLSLWHHPRFHAYFSNSSCGPAILAETLRAALNVNAMLWTTGPAASALERLVLGWMAEMIGYPAGEDSVLVNGASLATLYALAAARDAVPAYAIREQGLFGRDLPRFRLYSSDQAHSSVEKAAITLGVGTDNVVRIATDDTGRMRTDALRQAILSDLGKGWRPFAVVATVGTTATGAIDPVRDIAALCQKHDVWLHVDAAYGGFWRLVEGLRPHLEDLDLADSVVANPHKVLFCPMEATALYCKRKGALASTFQVVPEYLRTPDDDSKIDYMDYSLQLGREFRALKIWWIIRSFGRAGLASRLSECVDMASWVRRQAECHEGWRIPVQSVLPLVCLRYEPAVPPDISGAAREQWLNELNTMICQAVNSSGKAYLSHAVTSAGYVIRMSIGNIQTTWSDVKEVWDLLDTAAGSCYAQLRDRRDSCAAPPR